MSENTDVVINELNKLRKNDLIDLLVSATLPDHVTNDALLSFRKKFSEKSNHSDLICLGSEGIRDINIENGKNSTEILQIEVKYLRELLTQKDSIIANQAIAIESLKNQNNLLMKDQHKNNASPASIINTSQRNFQQKSANVSIKNAQKPVKEKIIVTEKSHMSGVTRDLGKHVSTKMPSAKDTKNISPIAAVDSSENTKQSHSKVNEWTEVKYRRPKQKFNRPLVVGDFSGSSKVEGIEKMKFLHVSNLKPDTKAEDLLSFLNKNFSNKVKCESLKSRFPDSYSSFKVTIPASEYEKALIASNWPNRASVRYFFQRRPTKPPG